MDETRYYNGLAAKYKGQLNIIGLAFERSSELAAQIKNIALYRKELNVAYPIYLSARASKHEASHMFSELSGITSLPLYS